jgi:hypothetical protein
MSCFVFESTFGFLSYSEPYRNDCGKIVYVILKKIRDKFLRFIDWNILGLQKVVIHLLRGYIFFQKESLSFCKRRGLLNSIRILSVIGDITVS